MKSFERRAGDPYREPVLKSALNKIALFAASLCSRAEIVVENGVNSVLSLGKAADFMPYLKEESAKQVFERTPYKHLSFEKALDSYRKSVEENFKKGPLTEENKKIGWKIMNQGLLSKAYTILKAYLPKEYPHIPLSDQFELDRKWIGMKAHLSGQGILNREMGKLCGELGNFFDPHMNGNLPFLLGTRNINGSKVHILRHPVTTIERGNDKISEEYLAFLENCKSKKEKVLYCCLLNPKKPREAKLMERLRSLELAYKDVFYFIRMPLDGSLSTRSDNEGESLDSYRKRVEMEVGLSAVSQGSANEFIFGSSRMAEIALKKYKAISSFAYDRVEEVYKVKESKSSGNQDQLKILLKEKKQAFMMLFCALFRTVFIKKLGVQYYSNVCKDAIDRGAANLMSDLLWEAFLAHNIKENQFKLRANAAWPAFMAKTQSIIKERSEWMISFAKWVEGAEELGLRDKIIKEYAKQLHLRFDRKMSFNDNF